MALVGICKGKDDFITHNNPRHYSLAMPSKIVTKWLPSRYADPSIISYFFLVRDEDESVMVKASQVKSL